MEMTPLDKRWFLEEHIIYLNDGIPSGWREVVLSHFQINEAVARGILTEPQRAQHVRVTDTHTRITAPISLYARDLPTLLQLAILIRRLDPENPPLRAVNPYEEKVVLL